MSLAGCETMCCRSERARARILEFTRQPGVLGSACRPVVRPEAPSLPSPASGGGGASGAVIRASGNNIFNNTTGFSIAGGAFIQSDGTNNTGGSNGGAGVPNALLTKN